MKTFWMVLLMAAILMSGVAIDVLGAIFNVVQGFLPVATAVFGLTSILGLVGRLRG